MNEEIKESTLTALVNKQRAFDLVRGQVEEAPEDACANCGLKSRIFFLTEIFGMTENMLNRGFYIRIEKDSVKYLYQGIVLSEFVRKKGNRIIKNYFSECGSAKVDEDLDAKIDNLIIDLRYWTDQHRIEHGIFLYDNI